MNFIKQLWYLSVLLIGSLSSAMEQREIITLVASDGTEFKINKDLITKLSPVIKDFLQPELQKTGIEQTRFELTSIKPLIIGSIVQAMPLIAPLEKVLCEGKENELHFYPFKEVKKALESWWQSVTRNLTSCPIATVPLLQQRFKGELLRAAHYLEIEPLEKYIAYKIAQELHSKNIKKMSEELLKTAGYGDLVESSYKLVKRYFTLISISAEEYTIADYILEKGQPKKGTPDFTSDFVQRISFLIPFSEQKTLRIDRSGITSLFGLSCIDNAYNIVSLNLADNKLIEIKKNELSYLPNIMYLALSNNNLQIIESGAFRLISNLYSLDLSSNKLMTLKKGIFEGLNELRTLYLTGARINYIEPGTFKGLLNLQKLSLQFNDLTFLYPNTFVGLLNLEKLYLHENKITTIYKDAFSGLNMLNELKISNNLLSRLEEGTFNGLANLNWLYLDHNQLHYLNEKIFNIFVNFRNLKKLSLIDNNLSQLPASLFQLKNCEIDLRFNEDLTLKTRAKLLYYSKRNNLEIWL
ncbi:MAG: leucine-rich repeat domain-containing protein [Candidatus Dependentiae bacterium]